MNKLTLKERKASIKEILIDYLEEADNQDLLDTVYQDLMTFIDKTVLSDMYERLGENKTMLSKKVGISKTTLIKRLKEYRAGD